MTRWNREAEHPIQNTLNRSLYHIVSILRARDTLSVPVIPTGYPQAMPRSRLLLKAGRLLFNC
jgi:hypothetical protein